MTNSPIHQILSDLRTKYTSKKVSEVDIRKIEEKYKICSILNFRNSTQAYLRITAYGFNDIMFEDIVLDYTNIVFSKDLDYDITKIKKVLFNLAYGVFLDDKTEPLLKEYIGPTFDLNDLESELQKMTVKCKELELKIQKLENAKNYQTTLFDI